MMRRRHRHWILVILGLGLGAGIFIRWLRPEVVRGVLDASLGMWCS
jgi:hypothetical protein